MVVSDDWIRWFWENKGMKERKRGRKIKIEIESAPPESFMNILELLIRNTFG